MGGAVLLSRQLHTLWRHSAGRVAAVLSAECVGGEVLWSWELRMLGRRLACRIAAFKETPHIYIMRKSEFCDFPIVFYNGNVSYFGENP